MTAITGSLNNARWLDKVHITPARVIQTAALAFFCIIIYFIVSESYQDDIDSVTYLKSPKIDDVYFLDFRKLSPDLRPHEKYRLAKVVDITGDVVTLLYGNMFFSAHKAAKDSIRYGQLRYQEYFSPKRYDFTPAELSAMHNKAAIYMIKRPDKNMLYGNYINDPKNEIHSTIYIPGKRENASGISFLNAIYLENNLEQAFEQFTNSANQGFAQGQVNLGQLHLNPAYAPKDLDKALYWFKQAALQSDKAGVLKYVIVCRQVSYCHEGDFFQELTQAGVNIKVREVALKLE